MRGQVEGALFCAPCEFFARSVNVYVPGPLTDDTLNAPLASTDSVPVPGPDSAETAVVSTVRGYPAISLSTDKTPGDLMLRDVATFEVYVMGFITIPPAASIGAPLNVTTAHAAGSGVAERTPLPQYVNESAEVGVQVESGA